MKDTKISLFDMKSIKVTHIFREEETISWISFNQFQKSFVNERWQGERRYKTDYTIFGRVHHKTIVKNPYSDERSVRLFDFPNSREEAEKRHLSTIGEVAQ